MRESSIIVNGQARPCPQPKPLLDFLTDLHLATPQVAIAINDHIIPRSRHAEAMVRPGDRVEIVHPVGGG